MTFGEIHDTNSEKTSVSAIINSFPKSKQILEELSKQLLSKQPHLHEITYLFKISTYDFKDEKTEKMVRGLTFHVSNGNIIQNEKESCGLEIIKHSITNPNYSKMYDLLEDQIMQPIAIQYTIQNKKIKILNIITAAAAEKWLNKETNEGGDK